MKGTLHKTETGWQVSHATYDMTLNRWTAGKFPVHPDYIKYYFLDEDAEGSEVEFEIEDFYEQGKEEVIKVAKLAKLDLTLKNNETNSLKINLEPQPNSISFLIKDEPIIVVDELGFKYKGELIEDAGEIYKLFKEFIENRIGYTEEQLKLAYMQGYNRGVDGNPNQMESYIEFLKETKKD